MSQALRELRRRPWVRFWTGLKITVAAICGLTLFTILVVFPVWFTWYFLSGNYYKDERVNAAKEAIEIANGPRFGHYYGTCYEKFPKKYRTKLQLVRQDLGLDPKDRFTCVFGGLDYRCPDNPGNWWPGDRKTAEMVREDIRKVNGDQAADSWFRDWDNVTCSSTPHGWGFYTQ